MALMVEVMCGILSGSSFGPHIRKWKSNTEGAADLVRASYDSLTLSILRLLSS